MTIYTSGKTTHDPEPWIDTEDGERATDARFWPWADYDPRPEFDNHNPVLVEFRKGFDVDPERDWVEIFLSTLPGWETGEVGHARRVLTKLAALRA